MFQTELFYKVNKTELGFQRKPSKKTDNLFFVLSKIFIFNLFFSLNFLLKKIGLINKLSIKTID